jgi:hypothetical protein
MDVSSQNQLEIFRLALNAKNPTVLSLMLKRDMNIKTQNGFQIAFLILGYKNHISLP